MRQSSNNDTFDKQPSPQDNIKPKEHPLVESKTQQRESEPDGNKIIPKITESSLSSDPSEIVNTGVGNENFQDFSGKTDFDSDYHALKKFDTRISSVSPRLRIAENCISVSNKKNNDQTHYFESVGRLEGNYLKHFSTHFNLRFKIILSLNDCKQPQVITSRVLVKLWKLLARDNFMEQEALDIYSFSLCNPSVKTQMLLSKRLKSLSYLKRLKLSDYGYTFELNSISKNLQSMCSLQDLFLKLTKSYNQKEIPRLCLGLHKLSGLKRLTLNIESNFTNSHTAVDAAKDLFEGIGFITELKSLALNFRDKSEVFDFEILSASLKNLQKLEHFRLRILEYSKTSNPKNLETLLKNLENQNLLKLELLLLTVNLSPESKQLIANIKNLKLISMGEIEITSVPDFSVASPKLEELKITQTAEKLEHHHIPNLFSSIAKLSHLKTVSLDIPFDLKSNELLTTLPQNLEFLQEYDIKLRFSNQEGITAFESLPTLCEFKQIRKLSFRVTGKDCTEASQLQSPLKLKTNFTSNLEKLSLTIQKIEVSEENMNSILGLLSNLKVVSCISFDIKNVEFSEVSQNLLGSCFQGLPEIADLNLNFENITSLSGNFGVQLSNKLKSLKKLTKLALIAEGCEIIIEDFEILKEKLKRTKVSVHV